jgi:hypothetical protein
LSNITFEIQKQISTLSSNKSKGWKKELNLISWNERAPKYDIRDWDSNHTKMGKGVTLSEMELKELYLSLKGIFESGISAKIEEANIISVEEEFTKWLEKAPLFIQEVKNVVVYLNEKGYSEDEKRKIILKETSENVEEALKNEVENLRIIYGIYFPDFMAFLKDMNLEELELFFILLETKC